MGVTITVHKIYKMKIGQVTPAAGGGLDRDMAKLRETTWETAAGMPAPGGAEKGVWQWEWREAAPLGGEWMKGRWVRVTESQGHEDRRTGESATR